MPSSLSRSLYSSSSRIQFLSSPLLLLSFLLLLSQGNQNVDALQTPQNGARFRSSAPSTSKQSIAGSLPFFAEVEEVEMVSSVFQKDYYNVERTRKLSFMPPVDFLSKDAAVKASVSASGEATATFSPMASLEQFAKEHPFWNNILIATVKTGFADLMAQTVVGGAALENVDWERSLLFCLFGAVYLGGFQYLYQVNIFRRLFDVDKFTSQSWSEKVADIPGLKALGAQTALDLGVSMAIYFPVFYTFKASVFSGSLDPSVWWDIGLANYMDHFVTDEKSCVLCWLPANLVCFSVPLFLRLPSRHAVSFLWTIYFSFMRGG